MFGLFLLLVFYLIFRLLFYKTVSISVLCVNFPLFSKNVHIIRINLSQYYIMAYTYNQHALYYRVLNSYLMWD